VGKAAICPRFKPLRFTGMQAPTPPNANPA
jgi:hypothetical protein